jgi:hypothetical protein
MPRLGGFIITPHEASLWASRISKKPVEDCDGVHGFMILLKYMHKCGFDLSAVCYPATVLKIMVVTQYAPHEGWLGDDDPTKLPQFEEGFTERITRQCLDNAGSCLIFLGSWFSH